MKKSLLFFLIFLLPAVAVAFGDGRSSGVAKGVNSTGRLVVGPSSGNDTISSSVTISAITGGGEPRGWYQYATYSSAENGNLPMGFYAQLDYSTSGVTSDHAIPLFGRVTTQLWTAGFVAGGEGNAWCRSILSGAYCNGLIGHAVYLGPLTSTPTAAISAVVGRSEIVDPADATLQTARTGNLDVDINAFEAQTYGGYADKRRNYNFRGFTTYGKIVNMGPLIAFSTGTQALTTGDTIQAFCGGITHVTAAAPATTNTTNSFQAPSTSLTSGLGNKDCRTVVVNELVQPITLDAQALFVTRGGIDVYLPSAAAVEIASTGGIWFQVAPVSYNALADIYVSSVTASSNVVTSTQFGNHGVISITPGDWSIDAACSMLYGSATVTQAAMAISINTGNTTTDQVVGNNQLPMFLPVAANGSGQSIGKYRIAVAATTSVYVKAQATYSGGTPTAACRITAERR